MNIHVLNMFICSYCSSLLGRVGNFGHNRFPGLRRRERTSLRRLFSPPAGADLDGVSGPKCA